jgi:hypothetical protein
MNRLNKKIVAFQLQDEIFHLRPISARLRLKAAEVRASVESLNESQKFIAFTEQFVCPTLAYSIVTEEGGRIYPDDRASDILDDFTGEELDTLQAEVMRISAMGSGLDDASKNSEPSQSASSPID